MPKILFVREWIPSLCTELHLLTVAGNQIAPLFRRCNMPHQTDPFQLVHLFMQMQRNGKEQFIIFPSIQGYGGYVHIECFGHYRSLIIDRYPLFEKLAAGVTLCTDMEQVGRQPVGYIYHGGGNYPVFRQQVHDIFSGFGF